jgi:hypothetical protein
MRLRNRLILKVSTLVVGAISLTMVLNSPASAKPKTLRPTVGRAVRHDVSASLSQMATSVQRRPFANREVNPLRPPRTGRPDAGGPADPCGRPRRGSRRP